VIALIISGVVIGCIYSLIAAGYAIVYRTTGVLNFAQGSFVMLSGMACSWLITAEGWSYPLAALGGLVLTIAAGAAIWMLVMAPMLIRRLGIGLAVIATLVVGYALTDAVLLWQGPDPRSLPAIQPTWQFHLGSTRVSSGQVYVIVGMALILLLLSAFLKYTPLGRATRASAADHETAQLLGISPVRVGGYAMCIAATVGALGGLLITPIQFTSTRALRLRRRRARRLRAPVRRRDRRACHRRPAGTRRPVRLNRLLRRDHVRRADRGPPPAAAGAARCARLRPCPPVRKTEQI